MEGFIMKKLLLGIFILAFASYAYAGTEVYIDLLETGAEEHAVYYLNDNQPAGRDLIWDNGLPDEENGLCCQRIGIVNQADVSDDFHLDATTTITGIEWDSVDDATYTWNETDDLEIYPWEGTVPGETPQVSLFNVPNTRESMGVLFSRPWWRYTIALDPADQFDLEAGAYFVLARPYNPGTSGQSFWLTSPAPAGSQDCVWFRCDYFGYYTWTRGDVVFGSEYDANFRLMGGAGAEVSCYFKDIGEAYVGQRLKFTKCYVNDTDATVVFEGKFVVTLRGKEVAVKAHPSVEVEAHSEVCVTYVTPRIPRIAGGKKFVVTNTGTAECDFEIYVNK
jgi:hypothetical protein